MDNEIVYVTETAAEREAYDALEALGRKWQARAAQEALPFELSRRTVKPKVSPLVKRSWRKPVAPSLWSRATAAVVSLFSSLQTA